IFFPGPPHLGLTLNRDFLPAFQFLNHRFFENCFPLNRLRLIPGVWWTAGADDFDRRGDGRTKTQSPKKPRCRDCRMRLYAVFYPVCFSVLPLTLKFRTRAAKVLVSLVKISA